MPQLLLSNVIETLCIFIDGQTYEIVKITNMKTLVKSCVIAPILCMGNALFGGSSLVVNCEIGNDTTSHFILDMQYFSAKVMMGKSDITLIEPVIYYHSLPRANVQRVRMFLSGKIDLGRNFKRFYYCLLFMNKYGCSKKAVTVNMKSCCLLNAK